MSTVGSQKAVYSGIFPKWGFLQSVSLAWGTFTQPKSTSRAHFGGQRCWSGEGRSLELAFPAGEHQHAACCWSGTMEESNTQTPGQLLTLLHVCRTTWQSGSHHQVADLTCASAILLFFSFFPVKRDFNYESRSQPQKIPKAQFPFSHTDQWNRISAAFPTIIKHSV